MPKYFEDLYPHQKIDEVNRVPLVALNGLIGIPLLPHKAQRVVLERKGQFRVNPEGIVYVQLFYTPPDFVAVRHSILNKLKPTANEVKIVETLKAFRDEESAIRGSGVIRPSPTSFLFPCIAIRDLLAMDGDYLDRVELHRAIYGLAEKGYFKLYGTASDYWNKCNHGRDYCKCVEVVILP